MMIFVLGAGFGGYLLITQMQKSNQEALAVAQAVVTASNQQKPAEGEEEGEEGEEDEEEEEEEGDVQETREPIFIPMRPALIVNFPDDGEIRYLQLTLDFKAYDPAVVATLDTYKPVIRNNLVILLSNKGYEDLVTAKGKEKIRDEITEAVQEILEESTGDPGIDSVYFTEFVIQ
ncbi:MAG TPA: hypothetical protein DCZ03_15510 [Gammaproteobacteria bacterium]|nr:hypothetical protein [Gammaproteobacteria bacterium]